MLNTYLKIAQHLQDKLPAINWIDRDKGQLDDEENYHSILTPAILLDFGEVQLTGTGRGNQLGEGALIVRLLHTKPIDTYERENSPLQDYIEFAVLAEQVHQSISKLKEVKERRKAVDYFTTNWYVIEQYYDLEFEYQAPVTMLPKPAPSFSTTINLPIQ